MRLAGGYTDRLLQKYEGYTKGALSALLILNSVTDQKLERRAARPMSLCHKGQTTEQARRCWEAPGTST